MAGDLAKKVIAVLISVESQDLDILAQVPRTNFQDTQDSARIERFQGPGVCKIV